MQTREARGYLSKDVTSAIERAFAELERIDFLWGKIRIARQISTPALKADVRMEYCVLNQILEFHGIVQTQMKRLDSLKDFLAYEQATLVTEDVDVETSVEIVKTTFESIKRVCHELRNAANVLRLTSRRRFPYCTHIDHSFKPMLPPELVVDFSVHRGELLVEVFGIAGTQKNPTNIPDGCATKKEFAGSVCIFRGQKVEIVDYTSISVPIPQLEEMLGLVDAQIAWLVHVRDNIRALLACHDTPNGETSPPDAAAATDVPMTAPTADTLAAVPTTSLSETRTNSAPTSSDAAGAVPPASNEDTGGPKPNTERMVLTGGGSERHLTGLRPKVPMRKRGLSFKETRKINTIYDNDGIKQVNQYTLVEELGRGAYGVVSKATALDTTEVFAIKMIDKRALKKVRVGRFGNALQSVKKELNIWKKFKHRHIVELREVIDSDDSDELYMVSELVEGGPVLDGDTECTPLAPELTKLYFCHLIEGIDFLHDNKVIHRDIKPGNLLLKRISDDEYVLKIADFGVSHEMENDDDQLRQTAGTAIFMAPEMLTGDTFHGRPIDVWACGITLYMFIYGHPPFTAKNMSELYVKIQNDPIVYPEKVGDRVVETSLRDLLSKILEKDPKKRYTTKDIRAHPWAWRDFQSSSIKCVTHPQGRRSSFTHMPISFSNVASIGFKFRRSLFGRSTRSVFPALVTSMSSPALPNSGGNGDDEPMEPIEPLEPTEPTEPPS
ncbi:TPA: hypothetical protein N0F65_005208 [Lagenidium giganteum]|uniref:Protein kinase domain-containing protein n=1 Tax=Lagenidium giganteum TaxID=4803 RepID=A0AAV2Z1W7_9STRA|nr:TPA: hypothetical protein N0F65_005208 [Lagenidium giganteum]